MEMSERFSIQTITALTQVVTGGPGGSTEPSIGLYRSGPQLTQFFGNLGLEIFIGSRVPSVRDLLIETNQTPPGRAKLIEVIEAATDPRDFIDEQEKLESVIEYLNKRLLLDGYQLKRVGARHKVVAAGANVIAAASLKKAVGKFSLESVEIDFEQALQQAETNPEGSITSACSTVESVCKCLLDEMNMPYPAKQDIKGLVTEVGKQLNLSPARKDLPTECENDIRQILSGLISVTSGIGSLRTHAGDAHGRGKYRVLTDARIARLAIHSASTVSLFFIETWQRMNQRNQ
ncbi:MAG: hypothetical protein DHS20C16_29960 [Phycisphaerae bacterium]|nr:MAG: hypothetical protein DHS20C16_29960 [Phycisphaerae bacterium]